MLDSLFRAVFLAITLLFVGGNVVGKEYFVSPKGDDAGLGTRERPWATIDRANKTLQRGDTATFLAGTHEGTIAPKAAKATSRETPADTITFRADTWLEATLTGPNEDTTAIRLQNCDGVVIEGFRVWPAGSTSWGRLTNSQDVTIRNCFMEQCRPRQACLLVENCKSVRLIDNVFKAERLDGNMVRLIACDSVVIEGNRLTRIGHSPLRLDSCNNIVVRANCFYNDWGRNYEFVGSGRVLVEGNIVTEAYEGMFSACTRSKNAYIDSIFRRNRVFGNNYIPLSSFSYFPMVGSRDGFCREPFRLVDSRIYHNTITGNLGYGWFLAGINVSQNVFKNNCFYRNDYLGGGAQIYFSGVSSHDNLFHFNLFHGANPGQKTVYYDGAQWTANEANHQTQLRRGIWTEFTGNVEAVPGFIDPPNHDFRLAEDGGAVDRGQALTYAIGSGTSRALPVSDAGYFFDGFDIDGEQGDWIAVGRGNHLARIVSVEHRYYQPGILHLDREVSRTNGMPVSLPWSREAPDIGAYENGGRHPSRTIATAAPAQPRPGQPVTFRIDPMGRKIARASWDFGDGTRATGPEVTHAYSRGKYGAIARAQYENGEEGVDVVFLEVQPPPAPGALMLHCSFEDNDVERWGHLMQFIGYNSSHRERGAGAERVEGGYESERSYRLFAEHYRASSGRRMYPSARLYPGEWNIDEYPFIRFAYRIPPKTPVALAVELYCSADVDQKAVSSRAQRTLIIGGTTSRESHPLTDTANYKLIDDGTWRQITIDVRSIRQVHKSVDYIRGFCFYASPNVEEGQQFWLDELSVMPQK